MQIERTPLPGVGVSYTFNTKEGQRLGVILHHGGHRELLIFDRGDRQRVDWSTTMDELAAHHLAGLLHNVVTEHD